MKGVSKPCVSSPHCDLGKPLKSPAQASSACHQAQSHWPDSRLASNQIFYFLCQASAISHFLSDLDVPNVGIHYHSRPLAALLSSSLSTVIHPQCASGAPSTLSSLRCPSSRSSSPSVPFTLVKRHSLSATAQKRRQQIQCNGRRSK